MFQSSDYLHSLNSELACIQMVATCQRKGEPVCIVLVRIDSILCYCSCVYLQLRLFFLLWNQCIHTTYAGIKFLTQQLKLTYIPVPRMKQKKLVDVVHRTGSGRFIPKFTNKCGSESERNVYVAAHYTMGCKPWATSRLFTPPVVVVILGTLLSIDESHNYAKGDYKS